MSSSRVPTIASRVRSLWQWPERGVATGAAWMLGAQLVRLVAQGLYYVLLARRLGAEGYGAFVAAVGTVSVVVPFASLGAGSFLIRGVARAVDTPDLWWGRAVRTVGRWGSLLSLLVVAVGGLVLHGKVPLWLLMGVALSDVVLLPLVEVSGQAFQALNQLRSTALIYVVWSALKLAGAVILTVIPTADLRFWAVLYPLATAGAALVGLAAVTRRIGWPRRATSFGRTELREGLLFSLSGSARTVYDDIDKVMLARLGSLGATGIYGAAYRIIDLAFLPIRALLFATYPRFFAHGASGVRAAATLARRLMPLAGACTLAVSAAFYAFAPLVPVVLGRSYAGVGDAIRWLAILPLFRTTHYFAADALTGSGHQGLRTTAQIGVAVLNVSLNVLLIPAYSWVGAAWASIASDGALALSLWAILLVLARRRATPPAAVPAGVSLASEGP